MQMNIVSKDIDVGERMSNKIHFITRIIFKNLHNYENVNISDTSNPQCRVQRI